MANDDYKQRNGAKKANGDKGLTWLPLGAHTKEEARELEKEFGPDWRDLFNGL